MIATVFETCEFNKVNVLQFMLSKVNTLDGLLQIARRKRDQRQILLDHKCLYCKETVILCLKIIRLIKRFTNWLCEILICKVLSYKAHGGQSYKPSHKDPIGWSIQLYGDSMSMLLCCHSKEHRLPSNS